MGATTFQTTARGETAAKAFSEAVQDARYEYGNRGYTGSIAEKHDFVIIPLPCPRKDMTLNDIDRFIDDLIDSADPRIDDKWGPAGCIDLGSGYYYFFGWASE